MKEKHIIIISIIGLVLLFHNTFNSSTIINEDFNNCKISTCSTGYVFDTNKTICIKSTSTPTPTPTPTSTPKSVLTSPSCMTLSDNIMKSDKGVYSLILKQDGNLVLDRNGTVTWSSNTINSGITKACI